MPWNSNNIDVLLLFLCLSKSFTFWRFTVCYAASRCLFN